jgi:integrase
MRQEVERREDGLWLRKLDSKSPYGKKPIPLSKAVEEALGAIPAESLFYFPSPRTGKPYDRTTISNYWKDVQIEADVPITTLYQLRHFFGTVQAKKHKDDILRRLMRHTDVRTTKQYYVDPFDEDLRAAVED